MRIVSVQAKAWTLALQAPFATAQRVAYEAQNVRVTVTTEDSAGQGIGEAAPVGYVTGESVETVLEAIAAVGPQLEGQPVGELGPLLATVGRGLADAPSARAGLEMALYDAWAKGWNIPLWQHFGGRQAALTTDVTIPIVAPDEAGRLAAEAVGDGFGHLKIKVGNAGQRDADLARVVAIARAAPQARLRVDANQGFAPDEAVSFARALAQTGAAIDLLEQPVPKEDFAGLKYVRARVPYPVFADEAARSPQSVLRLLQEDAVDGINVKLMKSGLSGALEIISLCRTAGKKLMLGCMLESPLGIAAAAHLAGGTGAFDFLDWDSHRLLRPINGIAGGFDCAGDRLVLQTARPGWGVTLPEEAP